MPQTPAPRGALAAILLLALVLRWPGWLAPLQQDEYGPLYAVLCRPTADPSGWPTLQDPLRPVDSFAEVRQRSLLPFGVAHPLPLYHGLLWCLVQLLPPHWLTLRLPSMLAGVAAVWVVARMLHDDGFPRSGLWSALFLALDPHQVAASGSARPYALGVLAFLLATWCLTAWRRRPRWWLGLAYGVSLAAVAHAHVVLLLAVPAHLLCLGWPWPENRWRGREGWLLLFLAGVVALAAMAPLLEWLRSMSDFSRLHADYVRRLAAPRWDLAWRHHAPVLLGLGPLLTGAVVLRLGLTPWGRFAAVLWLLPMLLAVLSYGLGGPAVFLGRYLLLTTLGGMLLLGDLAQPLAPRRPWLVAVAVLFVPLAAGIVDLGHGFSPTPVSGVLMELDRRVGPAGWQPGDVLLWRAGFLEADFLMDFPPQTRRHLENLCIAPVLTTAVTTRPRPAVVLPLTPWGGPSDDSGLRRFCQPGRYLDAAWAARVHAGRRWWFITPHGEDYDSYLKLLLGRLADAAGTDLAVRVDLGETSVAFRFPRGTAAAAALPGFDDVPPGQRRSTLVLIERSP